MGAQWKHSGRVENAAKRGQIISKMVKEIIMATKAGDPDPANNARLRAAVEAAKKASVPRDNIERAIKKGAGLLDPVNYELITFEGFAPHKVPCIIECLTENRNRTSADIRGLFKKGSLGASGSVSYMFNHLGVIEAQHPDKNQDIELAAIEAGAQEVEVAETGARFFCDMTDLGHVTKALEKMGWKIDVAEFMWIAKDKIELNDEQKKEVGEFFGEMDDNDDVHRIYTALK